jgi:hypothetical protein
MKSLLVSSAYFSNAGIEHSTLPAPPLMKNALGLWVINRPIIIIHYNLAYFAKQSKSFESAKYTIKRLIMSNFSSFFTTGPRGTLKFLNKPSLSYKGNWVQVFPDTEIDRWHVGEFASASYLVNVEFGSNKKEVMHVTVIARPDQASYSVYGRTSIDDELITFNASVTNSWMSLKVSPTDPLFTGAKLTMFAIYGETVNPLEPAAPISSGLGDVGSIGGNTEPGVGGGGGVSSNSFSNIAVAGQSTVIADSATDTLTLVAGAGITLTTNSVSDTITITGVPQSSDTLATVTARGATTNDALVVNNSITANDFISNGQGIPTVTSPTNLDLDAPTAVRVVGGGVFQLPRLTTVERDALTVASGSVIYNITLNKFQGYENGVWVNLV